MLSQMLDVDGYLGLMGVGNASSISNEVSPCYDIDMENSEQDLDNARAVKDLI